MRHLDQLLDELQEPIAQLMDWCDADKDRAIVACLRDLFEENSTRVFELLLEANPDYSAEHTLNLAYEILDTITYLDVIPKLDYVFLYQPLEHIINDRIDFYNRS